MEIREIEQQLLTLSQKLREQEAKKAARIAEINEQIEALPGYADLKQELKQLQTESAESQQFSALKQHALDYFISNSIDSYGSLVGKFRSKKFVNTIAVKRFIQDEDNFIELCEISQKRLGEAIKDPKYKDIASDLKKCIQEGEKTLIDIEVAKELRNTF